MLGSLVLSGTVPFVPRIRSGDGSSHITDPFPIGEKYMSTSIFPTPRTGSERISYGLSSVGLTHWCVLRTRMRAGPRQAFLFVVVEFTYL